MVSNKDDHDGIECEMCNCWFHVDCHNDEIGT